MPVKLRRSTLTAAILVLAAATAAQSVIIDSGDGSGNTSAPPMDPGWDYVGLASQETAIYLGNGWVITANHVGEGDLLLHGVNYPVVIGSKVRFDDGAGTLADLAVFRVSPAPPLPMLEINSETDLIGSDVIMMGFGRNRGVMINECGPPGIDGFAWGAGTTLRWGTNQVDDHNVTLNTHSLVTTFEQGASAHESQAAVGDSGGATFVDLGDSFALAGVIFAIGGFGCQSGQTALYGNATYSVDLAVYRDQIIATVPEPGSVAQWIAVLSTVVAVRTLRG